MHDDEILSFLQQLVHHTKACIGFTKLTGQSLGVFCKSDFSDHLSHRSQLSCWFPLQTGPARLGISIVPCCCCCFSFAVKQNLLLNTPTILARKSPAEPIGILANARCVLRVNRVRCCCMRISHTTCREHLATRKYQNQKLTSVGC